MATLTVEIPDSLNERLDREVAAGRAKDRNSLVQALLEAAMDAQWKAEMEDKIDKSLAEIERGEFVVHRKATADGWGESTSRKSVLGKRSPKWKSFAHLPSGAISSA